LETTEKKGTRYAIAKRALAGLLNANDLASGTSQILPIPCFAGNILAILRLSFYFLTGKDINPPNDS